MMSKVVDFRPREDGPVPIMEGQIGVPVIRRDGLSALELEKLLGAHGLDEVRVVNSIDLKIDEDGTEVAVFDIEAYSDTAYLLVHNGAVLTIFTPQPK